MGYEKLGPAETSANDESGYGDNRTNEDSDRIRVSRHL